MTRYITSHVVNPANDSLHIKVVDEPGPGGANHAYIIMGMNHLANPSAHIQEVGTRLGSGTAVLLFQNGAINEVGVNGITHEALIAVLIDRLQGFQNGPYANPYNEGALMDLERAQAKLKQRTQDRMRQGIEGTMAVGKETPQAQQTGGPGDSAHKGKPASGNPIMQYFVFGHLPEGPLRQTSGLISLLAQELEQTIPNGAEKSAGLRKLLEAKDCFVRAALAK